jgi:hypothetical protein
MIKKYRYFLLIALLFIILRLPSLFEPNWYGDEGIYLVLGLAIRKGLTLYSQIHDNKPPTLYYLAALSQSVFGFRLLLSLWMIPTIYAFYLLAQKNKIATIIFLIFSSIPIIEGNIANAEVFMLLPTILGIYLFLYKKQFFLPGLLLGLAFTIKVPVAVEFAFVCAYSFFYIPKNRILNILKLCFGFAAPISLYFLYFYLRGASGEFLFAALLQNFGYLSSWATGSHSGNATSGGLLVRGLILLLSWVVLYFYSKKSKTNLHSIFLFGWFASALFGAVLSSRPYPHYLIQVLPSLIIIIFAYRQLKALIFIPLIFFVFSLIKYKFYFYPVLSYYQNFYFHKNNPQFFNSELSETNTITDYIKSNTTPSDKIFVWGDAPFIYVASGRLPVGRFTVAYHIADFQQYKYIMDQLKAHPPKIIVYYPMNGRPFIELDKFIEFYYHPTLQSGSGIVYSLNQ